MYLHRDEFIITLKMDCNDLIWKYISVCIDYNYPMISQEALNIADEEIAYQRNMKINETICPISLKTFSSSFNQY